MLINKLEMVYDELKKEEVNISDKYDYSSDKTSNKIKRLTLGRIWFNLVLPDDFEYIDYEVNKGSLEKIIKKIYAKYTDPKTIADALTRLNSESFKMATFIPASYDISSFELPKFIIDRKREMLNADLPPDEFLKRSVDISKEYLEYLRKRNSGLYDIILSGCNGNKSTALTLATLMIAKGTVVDLEGNISKPIVNGLATDGLTLKEYYLTAAEARYGQYYKSNASQEPGYLARKVVFANSNILLDENDCGTKKYLKLKVLPSMTGKLNGRYYLNTESGEIENIANAKFLENKLILLRSPIYCKSSIGICKICYGDLWKELNTNKIGIVSGGIVNDLGVNSAMKLRNSSSLVDINKVDFTKTILENVNDN
ncbi:MAG: hypothetical protein IPH62_19470 [Ignavibacteriae bacterium]|nr:hypothetical protein [Ignavibacteriota bacterium]